MDVKQVIVIRKDLRMRRGKEIAQGAHASQMWITEWLKAYASNMYEREIKLFDREYEWLQNGTKKVTVRVESEKELVDLHKKAISLGLTSYIVEDEGLTEFSGVRTKTCLAIGPDKSDLIDKVTKELKLY